MANYFVSDTNLVSIANAIRTKGGTSGQLTFPEGFVNAVNAIDTSGQGSELDDLFGIKEKITLDSDATQLEFSYYGNGTYIVIGDVTSADAVAASKNLVHCSEVVFYGSNNLRTGVTGTYKTNGGYDYFATSASFTDNTKTAIYWKGDANGDTKFIAGHTYYLIVAK